MPPSISWNLILSGSPLSSVQAGGSSDRIGSAEQLSADFLHQAGPSVYSGIVEVNFDPTTMCLKLFWQIPA